MEILLVTPSVEERDATGAAVNALAKILKARSHEVTVVSPLYEQIDPSARSLARRLTKLDVELGGNAYPCTLYDGRTPRGVQQLFVAHDEVFGHAQRIDQEDASKLLRAAVFAHATASLVKGLDRTFDAVHAFEWSGALALERLRGVLPEASTRTVLTMLSATGDLPLDAASRTQLGLGQDAATAESALEAAAPVARHVTVPSRRLAALFQSSPRLARVTQALTNAGREVRVVPAGIDPALWNPAIDTAPTSRFDPMDLRGKAQCKAHLERQLGLPHRNDAPLFAVWPSSADDQGFEALIAALPDALRNDVQFVVLLDHAPSAERRAELDALVRSLPDRIHVWESAEADAAHELVAAADFLVVLAGEAGQSQAHLVAARYGALPIACDAGGFGEHIVDLDASLSTGTGLLFATLGKEDLLGALRRAAAAFQDPKAFEARQSAAM
ncbi:MAG: glycogen/starch synthase, partial [Myxococcales bacterium]|nr:glycogen/starch synthase [Myxococcales bacterium]